MMDISIDVKCAITTAILSVLIYLLLVNLLTRYWGPEVGKGMEEKKEDGTTTNWYKSMEVVMLVSVFIAFNFNNYLFNACKSA